MTSEARPLLPSGAVDVVSFGETMAVVTPIANESLEHAEVCQLSVGGAESNVLMLLARSGLRTRLVTRVGDDPLGRRVLHTVRLAGVDVPEFVDASPEATGVYFKERGGERSRMTYYRRGSAASTLTVDALEVAHINDARSLYLTGITPALSETCDGLVSGAIDAAVGLGATVLFDVNYRPLLWPPNQAAGRLLELALRANVVFVGLDEAGLLWNTATAKAVRDLFGSWPGHLIVKDGAVGATEFHDDGVQFVPATKVDVVDEIGAGDSFAAGYITALFSRSSSADRLRRGHRQAALALLSIRDVPDQDLL